MLTVGIECCSNVLSAFAASYSYMRNVNYMDSAGFPALPMLPILSNGVMEFHVLFTWVRSCTTMRS